MRMPVEGYDFLEDSVEELFERGSNLDSSEFMIPKDFETTFEYIIQDFNMLKARYEFSEDKKVKHDCIIQGCMLISGLLLFEYED